ncbi:MAG TPA: hypothetical protein VGQ99_08320 [Tepidisphaeraceae bacterium]|jgi:hypothetical protein|nr:hypothetical protein [Tepidisphaeraceae bacterium]
MLLSALDSKKSHATIPPLGVKRAAFTPTTRTPARHSRDILGGADIPVRHSLESLESRQLLSTITGTQSADTFYIRSDEEYQNIQLWVNANSATDAHTYDRYDTDSLIINASAGDDSLTLDLSNGNPLRDDIFTFNGGDGADGIKGDGRN